MKSPKWQLRWDFANLRVWAGWVLLSKKQQARLSELLSFQMANEGLWAGREEEGELGGGQWVGPRTGSQIRLGL